MARTSGRAIRDLSVMMVGAGGGQAIAFLLSPVISRLFTADDFGVFSVVNAGAMILGAIAALRLDAAIPLPKGEGEARAVLQAAIATCFLSCGAVALIIAAAGIVWGEGFEAFLGFSWTHLLGIPALGAAISLVLSLNQFAVRRGKFGAVGRRNFLSYGVGASSQTALGAAGFGGSGLILGLILGYLSALASLLIGARSAIISGMSARRLRFAIMRNVEFPAQFAPAAFMSALGVYLPPMLIAAVFGISAAGVFGFAHRVIALPVSLLTTAVSQYYLNRLVAARRESSKAPRELFLRTTLLLCAPAALGVLTIFIAGPWVFATVFGDEWTESGELGRWIALAMGAQLVASPLSQTLVVYRAAREQLIWDASRLVLVILTLWAVPSLFEIGLDDCLAGYAMVTVATYVASWLLSASKVRKGLRHA